jgi:hypothetical protein
MIDPSYPVEP